MSDSEDFLARWLRLKGESEHELPAAAVPSAPAFDPASLPPIESIVADTDIRQFLQAQVPEELTRAALRSAWTADPAIRDFVGISENQWDFNDPAAMAGFGPLKVTSYLVAQALGSPHPADQEASESSCQVQQAALPSGEPQRIDEVDLARAQEYSLLSTLLARSPDAQLLRGLAELGGDLSPLGLAHTALARAAARTDAEIAAREHFMLFVGLGRGELLPYASYYMTGFLHGRPLAALRQRLQCIGIERVDGQAEPEDHAAILLEIMAGLTGGKIAAPVGTDREIFEQHLSPWITRFFSDLEKNKSADFYPAVGMLGRTFMEIETKGFLLPP